MDQLIYTRYLLVFLLQCFIITVSAQDSSRSVRAQRVNQAIKIDGELNEEAWKHAPLINKFVEMRPGFGNAENENTKTEMWILYNDIAVYVAGFCHEASKDSISRELAGRDNPGINDFAGIMLDTYRDKINGVGFYVTALGEQFDSKYALTQEDLSWSTVYQTATKITDKGWYFEMKIPYSALRFSNNGVQNWGINFIRKRTKAGKQFSWNPINPNVFGVMGQCGTFTQIENIKSPVRLSFSPYFSSYLSQAAGDKSKKWESTLNGGMDVKYGISKSFTLDMTLIPDFGQVQSDNQVLNLSPFEVRYNENRAFFTEGTELFNKGNLFYSRRIGGTPIGYSLPGIKKSDSSTVIKNPIETKLVNATKISGRTAKGLGIGFFNAITKPQYAIIEDSNDVRFNYQTNPWTNYNILVVDQTLKNSSSVTLVNTSVIRSGHTYDANVIAGLFDLYDNKVKWNVWGKVANSRLYNHQPGKTLSGLNYEINLGKFKGPFNFEIHHYGVDDKYQQNDLGYFTNNNYFLYGFAAWYKINKPKGIYNNIFLQANGSYSQRHTPRVYQSAMLNLNFNSQLKNLWTVYSSFSINPKQHDFYEPRVPGKMFIAPSSYRFGLGINSNRAKKYSASVNYNQKITSGYSSRFSDFFISNQYRFNDKLTVGLNSYSEFGKNNIGFARLSANRDSSYFGLRNRHTVENIMNIKYNFNIKMGLTFRARHYWSKVDYFRYFNLENDGTVKDAEAVNFNPDGTVNFFNIDMIYTWEFAQGSFINIAWKNAAEHFGNAVRDGYYTNLSNTINSPQQNTFSVKVIYYLDYHSLGRSKK